MVLYLFGSKAELFRELLRLIIDPDMLVAALTEGDGRRSVSALGAAVPADLGVAGDGRDAWPRCCSRRRRTPTPTRRSEVSSADYVLTAVSGVIGGGEQARLRAMLAATSLVGTAMMRYVIKVPPLATLPAEGHGATARADRHAIPHRRCR